MKKLFSTLLFTFGCFIVLAHPGIGMVYDGERYIYYTDLSHVWKLDTKSGISEIFVENVHSHELALDNAGNIYGEHYWYVESEQKFKNYIWSANKNGVTQKIREDQYGENDDFSFVRDRNFNSYEIRKGLEDYEVVLTDSLKEKVLAKLRLNNPTWKYISKKDILLFVDYPSIYRLNQGAISIVAQDVSSNRFPFSFVGDEHTIYGVWTDSKENVYVALYGGREIRRINEAGSTRVMKSPFLWSPINGLFDIDNNLWVMECKVGGKIRVRKITQNELSAQTSFLQENLVIGVILISFLVVISKRIGIIRLKKDVLKT